MIEGVDACEYRLLRVTALADERRKCCCSLLDRCRCWDTHRDEDASEHGAVRGWACFSRPPFGIRVDDVVVDASGSAICSNGPSSWSSEK